MGLDSYDRFFPNQDTLPKGGFGNLIALPLQWMPRQNGNSLFVDDDLHAYPDQWKLLLSIQRVGADQVEWIVNDATRWDQVMGVKFSMTDNDAEDAPWTLLPSRRKREKARTPALSDLKNRRMGHYGGSHICSQRACLEFSMSAKCAREV